MSERLSDEELAELGRLANESSDSIGYETKGRPYMTYEVADAESRAFYEAAHLTVPRLIAELRAARVVVEAAKAWQRVYRSTGPREYMTRALNERARLSAVLDALAGAK